MRIREIYGDRNIIGHNVYKIRTAKGMNQREFLAKLQLNGLDCSEATISKIEGQQQGVKDYEIAAIAKVLNVSIQKLFEGDVRST